MRVVPPGGRFRTAWVGAGLGLALLAGSALRGDRVPASFASSGGGGKSVSAEGPAAEILWASSFDRAMEQAKAEGKFVLVDFFTYWCYWCKVLDQKTWCDPKVVEAASRLVSVKVNAESEVAVARKYGVRAYPTIVFLNPDGSLRQRLQGYQSPEVMKSVLQDVLRTDTEVAALSRQVEDNPGDAGIRRSYILALAEGGRYADAAAEVEKLLSACKPEGEERASLELDRWLYLSRSGAGESARKGLEGWVKKQKGHPRAVEARYFLGRAEEADGRAKQARKRYEEVARDGAGSWFALDARDRLARRPVSG